MKIRKPAWQLLAVLALIALRVSGEAAANVSYMAVAAYALLGRMEAVQALALSWLFSMLSPGIAPEAAFASIGRYAIVATSALSVIWRAGWLRGTLRVSRVTMLTLMLGGFLVLHSLIFSPITDVSVLKAISWTVTTAALLGAWGGLAQQEQVRLTTWVFGALVGVMLLSLPLLFTPLGYLRNGTGFQGILNHPQGFGPTMALLGAWTGARMLGERNPSWALVLLAGGCLVLVVLSEARTAGLAMVLGLGAAVLLVPGLAGRRVRDMLPGLMSKRVFLAVGASAVAALMAGAMLTDRLSNFLDKRGEGAASVIDAYGQSRGPLIEDMLDNIKSGPFTGIGFGIASAPDLMMVDRDPVLGLPTGAAIEKGVLPLAVLEEIGVFGAAAVLAWLFMVVRRASRTSVAALSLVLTTLLLNFGENTFFSPGGLGLLPLILLAWAATAKPSGTSRT